MRDSRGLRYLGQLLAHPGTPRHVFDLVDAAGDPSLASSQTEVLHRGETSDPTGRSPRRRRVSELREGVEDALAARDDERALALKAELDEQISDFLTVMNAGRGVSQVRAQVTRALRAAITRISDALPEAGGALERRVQVDALCVYEPDRSDQIVWSVELARIPASAAR